MLNHAYATTSSPAQPYTPAVRLNGVRLQKLREGRGWSLDDLARKTTLDRQTIHRIETVARKNARFSTAKKLAEAFGLPIAELEAKPRNGKEAQIAHVGGSASGSARVEDFLEQILNHVKTLTGQDRRDFINGIVAFLRALDADHGESATGTTRNDK